MAGPVAEESKVVAHYAAWQPEGGRKRDAIPQHDEGRTWQPWLCPAEAVPGIWADDGGKRWLSLLATALCSGPVIWAIVGWSRPRVSLSPA